MRRRLFNLPFGPELELGPEPPHLVRLAFTALLALAVVVALALAAALVLDRQPTDAEAFGTAPLQAAEPAVVIAGHPYQPHRGALYITAVLEHPVTGLERLVPAVLAWRIPDAVVVPLARLYGPHAPSWAQQVAQGRRALLDSEAAAEVAAYRALGYRVPLTTAGAGPRLPYRTAVSGVQGGGASAGLMIALAIVNRFGDRTRGYKIAGTGTIAPNGQVGVVGGVWLKTLSARRAGVRYMLVPAGEAAEARAYAGPMRVIPVRSLAGALAFLRHLR